MTVDCTIRSPWGEWSDCYSEHCGVGQKNRTRKFNQPSPVCGSDSSVEYKECYSPCSSTHHQGIVSVLMK